jgi:hypothetical protein
MHHVRYDLYKSLFNMWSKMNKEKGKQQELVVEESTTVQLRVRTRKRIVKYAKYGMTIDDIINHIIDIAEATK